MKKYILTLGIGLACLQLHAQEKSPNLFEIYGQVVTDMGYNFNQVNPDYFDVMRPTQLPSYKNQYGTDGNIFFSARQTGLGVKSTVQTPLGVLNATFSFDLFGMGVDAGQTTFHMLYAYAELGKFGAGFNWSLFCDFGGYPNIIEYWGPSGLALCRNVQFRFIPINGKNRLAIALERPGASADQGIYSKRIELEDVTPKFNIPDLTAEFRMTRNWGYAELAGVFRKIKWEDNGQQPFDLSGSAYGWGFNLSTNLNLGKKTLFLGQTIIGQGIENFMNDAPTDIGIKKNFSDPNSPVKGVALPLYSYSAYINHQWNEKFSSVIGYAGITINNSDAQSSDAFHQGTYMSTNLLYYPVPNLIAGIELQRIHRKNFNDGWQRSATRIQVSFRYSFSQQFGNKE